jgi:hypothetical protein
MGIQFEQITYASPLSLTQIVDDTALLRQQGVFSPVTSGEDVGNWLNAVQLQSRPLIQSGARRAQLEAWLEAAELASPTSGL